MTDLTGRYIRSRETGGIYQVIRMENNPTFPMTGPRYAVIKGTRTTRIREDRIKEGSGRKNAYQLLPECFVPGNTANLE